jgi:hypothetical protein
VYRRKQVWFRTRQLAALIAFVGLAFTVTLLIGQAGARLAPVATPLDLAGECAVNPAGCSGVIARPDLAPAPPPRPKAVGFASTEGIGDAAIANIDLALELVDRVVIEPGGSFSFDDTARTWDYSEDDRYLWGLATSLRGPIWMRGGGVCWLSTAIWRAALEAGLPTGLREAHYGLVTSLGPGLDATNTLIVENDSPVPITIRAWRDDEAVYAAIFADGSLGRTARVDGPISLGRGIYTASQHVVWDDGSQHVTEFSSRYYW